MDAFKYFALVSKIDCLAVALNKNKKMPAQSNFIIKLIEMFLVLKMSNT